MQLTITVQDLLDMFEEIQSQTGIGFQVNGCETSLHLPSEFGKSLIRNWHLRDGLELYVQTHDLTEEIMIASHNHYAMFGLCYGIAGTVNMVANQSRSEVAIRPGSCLSVNMTDAQTVGQLPANQSICLVELAIAPHLLQDFLKDELDTFPASLRHCFQTSDHFYWQQGATTSAMRTTLHQILQCPYQGATQRLYLESKALELITFQLHQLKETHTPSSQRGLKSDEVERIYQARDILIQRLHNPPTLIALARQVGLNDCKLKQGFHQVFGTTAFGCLHQHRMEQARQLLETQPIQVAIAAHTVGYSSLSSFHRAYKKYFGVNPGEHRYENRS
ncbi:helix-turn-helix transcriptional regulator [Phormidesmis sp. 146-12]